MVAHPVAPVRGLADLIIDDAPWIRVLLVVLLLTHRPFMQPPAVLAYAPREEDREEDTLFEMPDYES
jgi:hypothetical protein